MAGKGRKAFWDDRRERFSQLLAAGVKAAEAAKPGSVTLNRALVETLIGRT